MERKLYQLYAYDSYGETTLQVSFNKDELKEIAEYLNKAKGVQHISYDVKIVDPENMYPTNWLTKERVFH